MYQSITWQLTAQRQSHPPKSWSSWPTVVDLLAQLILEFYWQDLADLLSLHPQSSKEYAKVLSLINLKRSWCGKLSFVQDTASIPIWILMAQVLPKPQHCVNPKCSSCLSHILMYSLKRSGTFLKIPSVSTPPLVSVRFPACESMTDSQETSSSKAKV